MFLSPPFLLLPSYVVGSGSICQGFHLKGNPQLQDRWRPALPEMLNFHAISMLHFQHVSTASLTPAEKFSPCYLHRASRGWQKAFETNIGLLPNFDVEQWGTRAFQRVAAQKKWWWVGEFQPKHISCFQYMENKSTFLGWSIRPRGHCLTEGLPQIYKMSRLSGKCLKADLPFPKGLNTSQSWALGFHVEP